MRTIQQAATDFLSHKRVAVTGVSRHPESHGANLIFQRLRGRGYEVYPVNPNATEVEGTHSYPNLASIPGGVEAVVIATRAGRAEATMRECSALGIHDVWMHRAFGDGSVSPQATAYGRTHGIRVIDGGCPLMFEPTADGGHKLLRWACTWTGKVPRQVS